MSNDGAGAGAAQQQPNEQQQQQQPPPSFAAMASRPNANAWVRSFIHSGYSAPPRPPPPPSPLFRGCVHRAAGPCSASLHARRVKPRTRGELRGGQSSASSWLLSSALHGPAPARLPAGDQPPRPVRPLRPALSPPGPSPASSPASEASCRPFHAPFRRCIASCLCTHAMAPRLVAARC